MSFTTVETLIFTVLAILFIGLFAVALRKTLRIILEGRDDKNRHGDVGLRIARVVREVIFQQRVLGSRPFAGAMHAIVFAAFMFFAIETLNMMFESYGIPFIHAVFGDYLLMFRKIVTLIAILCTISMVGFVLRRFVFTKFSPDPTSKESGFVALLIMLLMLTYIDLFNTHIVNDKINWWAHIIIILSFPMVIVNSKHRHLFLAPFAIYFRNERLWDVEKMNLDFESVESEEDMILGLEKLADIPWKLRLDFFACVECRRCTDNCPASQAGQELKPADFIIAGRNALVNGTPEDEIIGTIISEKALGQCTSCMACENVCPVGVEHSQLLFGAKAAQTLALGTGVANEFHKVMTNHENPFSASDDVRKSLIEECELPAYEAGKTEYLLWLGCVWAYNPDFKNAVKSLAGLLNAAGVSYGVIRDEKCCGHHSRKQGEEMMFQTLAEVNSVTLTELNCIKIITGCPHCLNSFNVDYGDFIDGSMPEVYHHSQILTEIVAKGKLKINSAALKDQMLTYHDPCYLGRHEGQYKEPRSIIESAGGSIKEMKQTAKYSYCCGGGAAGFTLEAKEGQRVDQVRKEHIKETEASLLVTSCPECKMMLNGTLKETKDLCELLYDALEK